MNEDIDWKLVTVHLSGGATPEQEAEIRARIAADPAWATRLQELRAIWNATGSLPGGYDTEAALARHKARRPAGASSAAAVRPLHPTRSAEPRARRRWPGAGARPLTRAAAVLAAVAAGAALWGPARDLLQPPGERVAVEYREIVAPERGRRRVDLEDGSVVLLGSGSRLRVPRMLGTGTRDVYLTGVASFEVTPDPDRPFRVFTERTVTRVLGTKFVLRAVPGAPETQLAVGEGRVLLQRRGAPEGTGVVLGRGQAGAVGVDGRMEVAGAVGADPTVDWAQGRLSFRDAPLPEALKLLEVWYGVELRLGSAALASRHVTFSVHDEPLPETLDLLAALVGGRHRTVGRDTIVLGH